MEDAGSWRLANSIGIPFRVVSRNGDFSYEGATAKEEYIIRASDLLTMAQYGFPEPTVWAGTLMYPQQPVMPGIGTLVPKKITWDSLEPGKPCDPFNSDPSAPNGTYCDYIKLGVHYGVAPENDQPPDSNDPFTFLEVNANASGVFINSPLQGKAEWELQTWSEPYTVTQTSFGGGTTPIVSGESTEVNEPNIPHTVTETQVEWSVRWPQIPFSFWSGTLMGRLRSKLGRVNENTMSLLHNAPAETVLFLSYSASASYTWRAGKAGLSPIQLTMNFLEKNFEASENYTEYAESGAIPNQTGTVNVTHQHIWRPNYGWRKLKIGGNYLYATANLNQIWSPS